MDSNMTEKLNNFTALVMRDAQAKRDEIMDKVDKEYHEELDKKENELLGGAYSEIQATVAEARREAAERVLHAETESRKQLIKRREEIIAEVMTAAREKLAAFTKSSGYSKWLAGKAKAAVFELGEGKKTVYISPSDVEFKEKLEALEDGITVLAADKDDLIGGVRVVNTDRHISADYTLSQMLEEQKRGFLQTSGLALS